MMTLESRVVISIRDGARANSKDETTVDMVATFSTYRDLEQFLQRALKAAKAVREFSAFLLGLFDVHGATTILGAWLVAMLAASWMRLPSKPDKPRREQEG